ncbi:MAG: hypothetical protein OXU72_11895, partial [Gammaproteobacteria bacterium]|nr:hypothetical protein [Gammaproteobacteria bacterium]
MRPALHQKTQPNDIKKTLLQNLVNLSSEFACGASLSAHGHIFCCTQGTLLHSRFSDELNAPKG